MISTMLSPQDEKKKVVVWGISLAAHLALLLITFSHTDPTIVIKDMGQVQLVPVHLSLVNRPAPTHPEAKPIEEKKAPPIIKEVPKQPVKPAPPSTPAVSGKGPRPESGPAQPSRLPGDRDQPELGGSLAPVYPKIALNNEWEGTVRVNFAINDAGRAISYKVLQSTGHPELDNAFINTVMTYGIFEPKKVLGKSVEGSVSLEYTFELDNAL